VTVIRGNAASSPSKEFVKNTFFLGCITFYSAAWTVIYDVL